MSTPLVTPSNINIKYIEYLNFLDELQKDWYAEQKKLDDAIKTVEDSFANMRGTLKKRNHEMEE